jgi:hypothetical protein
VKADRIIKLNFDTE